MNSGFWHRVGRALRSAPPELAPLLIFVVLVALAHSPARAQQPLSPRVGYVYPAGGKLGTTFQVKVGGQFLDGVTNVYVSGSGVRASVLQHKKPLTPQQFNSLREKAKELQDKRQAIMRARKQGKSKSNNSLRWTAEDEKALAEIRAKLAGFQRRPPNPAIAETVTLHVSLTADAEPGRRELRLRTPQGLSNPLVFCVGQLPEVSKREPPQPNAFFNRPAFRNSEPQAAPPTEMTISIPVVVNGQILPGGVDRYRFHARHGQRLVIAVSARELIPYLPDGVPGWFQATLTLYDSKGKELAYSDDFRFCPDPVLYFEVPNDADYLVEIKDSVYRGREDFVYRISISESPFVTAAFPLGAPAGKDTTLALRGWNLQENSCILDKTNTSGIHPLSVRKEKLVSNPFTVAVDTLPELLEKEGGGAGTPVGQPVLPPIIVNGRIDQPGDRDLFIFEGRAGQQISCEVHARRLGSPLDSFLLLRPINHQPSTINSPEKQLAFNDDWEDKASGLNTHHADSYLLATLPADGTYSVEIRDAQRQGGADYAYRLRVSAPRPDFELRVTPSSINVRAGMSAPITVYALRKDGFTNEVTLALDEAPAGFSLGGARIPAGMDQVRLTLAAPAFPPKGPVNITIQGRAKIGSKFVSRKAVPAEDMMQAFAYRHLVPCQELKVAVIGRGFPRAAVQLANAMPVKIPAGGTARVQLGGPGAGLLDRFDFELSEPPDGVTIAKVARADQGTEIVLQSDNQKSVTGLKGNLIVGLVAARNPAAQKAKKQANVRRVALGTLPAIPFEIISGPGN